MRGVLLACPGEDLLEPPGVNELRVVREPLDRGLLRRRPGRPVVGIRADARSRAATGPRRAPARHRRDRRKERARARRRRPWRTAARGVAGIQDAEPRARERDSAGDVTASCLSLEAPSVVGRQRARVDDREAGIGEAAPKVVRRHPARHSPCSPSGARALRFLQDERFEDDVAAVPTAPPSSGTGYLTSIWEVLKLLK